MNGERFSREIEVKLPVRIRRDALAVFLLHHIPLRTEIGIVQRQRRHAFRLRPQNRFEIIRWHALVVNGHIVGRVGIVFAANVFGQIVERLRPQMLVPLEHHVLEQMRETAPPVRIVLRSNMIPNVHRDRETRMIFRRVNLKPVLERLMSEVDRRDRHRCALRGVCGAAARRETQCRNGDN